MKSTEIPVTVLLTLLIIWFSWYLSIKEKRYHGIFRFFSFESILLIVILNYPVWFDHPAILRQVISWALLFLSVVMAFVGFGILTKRGKPEGKFENTTRLITTGIYAYIRHPLYLSLLLLGTGAVLKDPGLTQVVLGIVNIIALYFTAISEEKEMVTRFGNEYKDYMKRSKMFLPYIF